MITVGTNKTVGWNRSSPIPTDPCFESYGAKNSKPYKLESPIPADKGHGSSQRSSRPSSPKPRIKPEALAIARNNQGRELAYLFNPEMKVIPIGVRSTHKEQVDYGKENYRKIKEIQRANKEKQVESSRQIPMKVVYKPDKFDHVQSKVAQQIKTPLAPRPTTTDGSGRMLRSSSMSEIAVRGNAVPLSKNKHKNSLQEKTNLRQQRPSSARLAPKKIVGEEKPAEKIAQRPATAGGASASNKRPKSHIQLNKEAVKKSTIKRSPSMSALDDLKKKREKETKDHRRGAIPEYLRNRKEEWKRAEEERIANQPDPTVPEGHALMADEERKRTLSLLRSSHAELMSELKAMPLSRDTMRIKNRKDEIERKLREVDSAIKIFSRPRVFIKNE